MVYTVERWLLYFFIYGFVGWCLESAIVSLDQKMLVNRGFLRGPLLPLYGCGATVMLLVCLPVKYNPVLVYLCGMAGATVLEYVTGWLMETLFKTKYWDYSHMRYQFQGRISLTSSLFWGVLALVLTYVLHRPVAWLVDQLSHGWLLTLDLVLLVIALCDAVYAIKTALDVNRLLANITRVREELAALRRQKEPGERMERLKNELSALYERFSVFMKSLVRAHPTAQSRQFNEALTDLKERLSSRKKK